MCIVCTNRNTILKYSIHYISRMHVAACVQFSPNLAVRWSLMVHSSEYKLFKLVKMPAILDSLFHMVLNITSTPIGMEGGGVG